MSSTFLDMMSVLENLPWKSDSWKNNHHLVEELLDDVWQNHKPSLFRGIAYQLKNIRVPIINRTSELHSWMLHDSDDFCVKLNQFKPSPLVGKASENIHQHTRPLTTLTFHGRYSQDYYFPWKPLDEYQAGDKFDMDDLERSSGPTTSPGFLYTIGLDVFHALTGFDDGTLTLCVYGPVIQDNVVVFNTVTGEIERRTTCNYAKDEMMEQLSRLAEA